MELKNLFLFIPIKKTKMKELNYLKELLALYGVYLNIDESSSPVILFALSILILSFVAMWCFITIVLYLGFLYLMENKVLLEKASKYNIIVKILNVYKKTRLFYLVIEIALFLISLGSIILLSGRIVFGLISFGI